MIRKILLVCFLSILGLTDFSSAVSENMVKVYYFHGSMRCPTCHKLEQYSKEAVESNFKDELTSGKLEFKVVNIEERGNEHFIDDYKLYTKSLVLSLLNNGKEVKSENLDKIWEYVGNKQKFLDYVRMGVANSFVIA